MTTEKVLPLRPREVGSDTTSIFNSKINLLRTIYEF